MNALSRSKMYKVGSKTHCQEHLWLHHRQTQMATSLLIEQVLMLIVPNDNGRTTNNVTRFWVLFPLDCS